MQHYAIDLFCGAGGLSYGFQEAGFNIIVGVDNEQAALNTFELNHPGAVGLNADLSKAETVDEIRHLPLEVIICVTTVAVHNNAPFTRSLRDNAPIMTRAT